MTDFLIFLLVISPYIVIPAIILFISIFSSNNQNKDNNNIKSFNNYYDVSNELFKKYFDCDIEALKQQLFNKFCDIQNDWMNFDYDGLRGLCTDELYNQYKTLLESLKLKNEQNIMSDFSVKEVSIYNIKKFNDIIEISVYLDIKFKDYIINKNTKKIVRGSKKIYFNNSYELTFIMSNKDKIIACLSCGTKVEVVSSNMYVLIVKIQ